MTSVGMLKEIRAMTKSNEDARDNSAFSRSIRVDCSPPPSVSNKGNVN